MPEAVDLGHAVSLKPEEAVRYFRAKGYALTWNWREMSEEAHAVAFTVAKSAGYSVLGDIRLAFDKALAEGRTERQFAAELEPVLRKKGWWGRVTNEGGETVQLGSPRRLRTIFRTNWRTAHAAARYKQQLSVAERGRMVAWMYDAVDDSRTRPSHRAMDNMCFRFDDPIWQTHYPPNGFNCRCKVRGLTARQVRDRGLEVRSSEGHLVPVDQDFGARQTTTMGYDVPGADEVLTPDPGFGRRPLPEQVADQHLADTMRRAFHQSADEVVAAGRRTARRIARIGPTDKEIVAASGGWGRRFGPKGLEGTANPTAEAMRRERGRLRREALHEALESRGGHEIRTLRATSAKARPVVARMRELSRLLPADWVRRANSGPGVRVSLLKRLNGGNYDGAKKWIKIGESAATDEVLLHELVHHLQEMHPDLDALFDAWYWRRNKAMGFRPYANRLYGGGPGLHNPNRIGAVVGQINPSSRKVRPLELMTTAFEALAQPSRGPWSGQLPLLDVLDEMIVRDPDFFEFVVGLLLDW